MDTLVEFKKGIYVAGILGFYILTAYMKIDDQPLKVALLALLGTITGSAGVSAVTGFLSNKGNASSQ